MVSLNFGYNCVNTANIKGAKHIKMNKEKKKQKIR